MGKILFLLPFLAWCGGEGRDSELGSGSCNQTGAGSAITVALFQSQGGKQLLEV